MSKNSSPLEVKSLKNATVYKNRAIDPHNRLFARRFSKKKLLKESALVADDSMAVLGEFEKFEESAFWKSPVSGQQKGDQHEF